MAFLDILLPTNIRITSSGGPEFNTEIAVTPGGYERRNILQDLSIHKYSVDYVQSAAGLKALKAFFLVVHGSAYSFRYKDWTDYQIGADEGVVVPDGVSNALQLVRRYEIQGFFYDRDITKPVVGTITMERNGSPLVDPTHVSINYTTGVATFVGSPPLISDVIRWQGEFHVPCRFDTDRFRADGVSGTNVYGISGLTLTEDLIAGLD